MLGCAIHRKGRVESRSGLHHASQRLCAALLLILPLASLAPAPTAAQTAVTLIDSEPATGPREEVVLGLSQDRVAITANFDGSEILIFGAVKREAPIPQDDPHFVTLNTRRTIREELIYDQVTLRHPVYDLGALAAQKQIAAFNGAQNTWFCDPPVLLQERPSQ